METAMLQFRHAGSAPSMDEVCRLFSLAPDELDRQFGVIATDPADGLYTVLIDARAAPRVSAALAARPAHPAEGLFANPPIEPFDLPDD
ncbi:hypothetical protein [Novosphingobium sp.]|uniref:hypothetical protein n=1 Tax=Novosphingobium sp. TaxID=1874826 RepID=UPI0025E202CC|nr:hypothetical protein [Novosphingobium sp.]